MFNKGQGVLKMSHWEKRGEGGELYGILECSSDIEGKKVSILVPSKKTKTS